VPGSAVFVNNPELGTQLGSAGLGSWGLFVPLWQMIGGGSRRNRPKIVPAAQTFRLHQCTPLCNNTNFVVAEKSIFSPLKRAPAASGPSGGPQLPDCRLPTPSPLPRLSLHTLGLVCFPPDPQPESGSGLPLPLGGEGIHHP
jgi:hypothetical protein